MIHLGYGPMDYDDREDFLWIDEARVDGKLIGSVTLSQDEIRQLAEFMRDKGMLDDLVKEWED